MSKFKVQAYFTDLQDNEHVYHTGDIFPREGLEVSDERIAELSSNQNKRGVPLIVKIMDETKDTEEYIPKPEEDTQEVEADVNPSKTTKAKKNGKKKQE